jgi:glycosyltransferase involved in cell wall biosynthesis
MSNPDDTTKPPLITVGVTCYNAEDTIARAIDSARMQDWDELEILAVDDCSQDRTAAVVEGLAKKDERVRLIRHGQNGGPGAARETLLNESRGQYLAFFDDDDESARDRLSVQYRRLVEYREETGCTLAACYGSGRRVYENGYELGIEAIGSAPRVPIGEEAVDYLLFNGRVRGVFYGAGTPACALMASTETMRAVGGFDPAFRRVEDVDFAVRLGLGGGHFVGCPEQLYTQHATQAPDKSARRNYDAEIRLLEKHRHYLEQRNRYDFARNWFTVRYHHFNGDRGSMMAALTRGFIRNPLLVLRQLVTTVPARAAHERRMARGSKQ